MRLNTCTPDIFFSSLNTHVLSSYDNNVYSRISVYMHGTINNPPCSKAEKTELTSRPNFLQPFPGNSYMKFFRKYRKKKYTTIDDIIQKILQFMSTRMVTWYSYMYLFTNSANCSDKIGLFCVIFKTDITQLNLFTTAICYFSSEFPNR